jgi:hypothetical protein
MAASKSLALDRGRETATLLATAFPPWEFDDPGA